MAWRGVQQKPPAQQWKISTPAIRAVAARGWLSRSRGKPRPGQLLPPGTGRRRCQTLQHPLANAAAAEPVALRWHRYELGRVVDGVVVGGYCVAMQASARPTLTTLRRQLRAHASAADAAVLQRFFKTDPGEYAAGDAFLGVRVPATRQVARGCDGVPLADLRGLLRSRWHEERLLALLALVRRFERGDGAMQEQVFQLCLDALPGINNWDLVDLSAPNIVGAWLLDKPRGRLDKLAGSACLWERRIAVVATLAFIRRGEFADTLRLCRRLLADPHDLLHKACGWMLREVGKRDERVLRKFIGRHSLAMPRTMLRYAIERFPEAQRKAILARRPAAR